MSTTVTVNEVVRTLPVASVAVYVTVVVPTAKVAPELCVWTNETKEQLSVAVASVQETSAVHNPASTFLVMFAGVFAMSGFSSSVTVTICVSLAVLPEASVTIHVTVVLPSEKFAGASLVTVYEQLSAAVALPKATPEAVQMPKSVETDTSAGAVMVGDKRS